jgi:hypothetical protein
MDFSNLEAVLQGLLADAQRMQRIADAAYGVKLNCTVHSPKYWTARC